MLLSLPKILHNRIVMKEDGWHLKEPYTAEEKKAFDDFLQLKEEVKKRVLPPLPLE